MKNIFEKQSNGGIIIKTLLFTFLFIFGRSLSNSESSVKKFFRVNISKDTTNVKKLLLDNKLRSFIEYNAKERYKVKYHGNLQSLSDEVFFTMVSEINEKKIPYSIFFRLIDQESHFLYVTNKRSGAKGFTQLLPSTERMMLKRFGSTGNYLVDNIRFGAQILKMGYERHRSKGHSEKESWFRSLVNYNGGSSKLARQTMLYFETELPIIEKGD